MHHSCSSVFVLLRYVMQLFGNLFVSMCCVQYCQLSVISASGFLVCFTRTFSGREDFVFVRLFVFLCVCVCDCNYCNYGE